MNMQKIKPCLWFDNQAEEAAKFYGTVFKNSKIGKVARYSESGAKASGQPAGSAMTVEFQIDGHQFLGLNGGPIFKFTPAVSFFVGCESEQDINEKWSKLSAGGRVRMELNKYPWAEKYGWCDDKYGVGWQLILVDNKKRLGPAFLFSGDKFGLGEQAIQFYTSIFDHSKLEMMAKDEKTNSVMHAAFKLEDQDFFLMETPDKNHNHEITHAISFIVNCKNQEEVDSFWTRLSAGGAEEQCGWLKDKFGVSWQIVPSVLGELMSDADKTKTEKVMKALLKMKKINIAELNSAFMG
jgi:predicted 3-demethylubiquinone-9 3-methyltransferase (glyoxalase superfamily)